MLLMKARWEIRKNIKNNITLNSNPITIQNKSSGNDLPTKKPASQ